MGLKDLKVVGIELGVSGTHFVSTFGVSTRGSVHGAHLGEWFNCLGPRDHFECLRGEY